MTTPIELTNAYDAGTFRRHGHAIVDRLADHLERVSRGVEAPVLPPASPRESCAAFPDDFAHEPRERFDDLIARVLATANQLHHPRYMGHQVTAPLPLAALCELAGALLNNSMAVYEMGPSGTAMERAVLAWLARSLGYGEGARGVLTSGGSVGNLTALLAARRAKAPGSVWSEGLSDAPPLAILVSRDAHYSVERAAAILGLGQRACQAVEIDAARRMRPDALAAAFDKTRAEGRTPIAVVANAGATPTGSFDPLVPIADFCGEHDLWLHVDGAHGASAALSPRYRGLIAGIERADSVVWDAHKMMMMPALVTAVIFRDGRWSRDAFAQEASYLFNANAHGREGDEGWFDVGQRTLECTKRMLSLPLYACLRVLGTAPFTQYVERTFDLARRFHAMLAAAPDFDAPVAPEANIVCFRYMSTTLTDVVALDALQARVRKKIVESGRFYLVQTLLGPGSQSAGPKADITETFGSNPSTQEDRLYLRTALMNPHTSEDDLAALLEAVREAARECSGFGS